MKKKLWRRALKWQRAVWKIERQWWRGEGMAPSRQEKRDRYRQRMYAAQAAVGLAGGLCPCYATRNPATECWCRGACACHMRGNGARRRMRP